MRALLNPWIARLPAVLPGLGPYAAIELLLPGGSIIALLIWLYRQRTNVGARQPWLDTIQARPAVVENRKPIDDKICAIYFGQIAAMVRAHG